MGGILHTLSGEVPGFGGVSGSLTSKSSAILQNFSKLALGLLEKGCAKNRFLGQTNRIVAKIERSNVMSVRRCKTRSSDEG